MYRFYSSHGVIKKGIHLFIPSNSIININSFCYYNSFDMHFLGWGLKPSASKVKAHADKHNLPFWRVEDGFIGYLNHPTQASNLLSLSVDTSGIYYDATQTSDLERYIKAGIPQSSSEKVNFSADDYLSPRNDEPQLLRVQALQQLLIKHQVTKYNLCGSGVLTPKLSESAVLVIDQTFGDLSVEHSYASAQSFDDMLAAAVIENPTATIYIKTHPDVLLGTKQGFLARNKTTLENKYQNKISFIFDACNPIELMQQVSKVYTVCSQMGFEALISGKPVITFGCPFYAGWGLTDDRGFISKRRNVQRNIEELIYAAFIQYPRYVHPDTQKRCDVEDVIDYIALQKKRTTHSYQTLYCCDFSLWKRAFLPLFLQGYAKQVKFVKSKNLSKLLNKGIVTQQDAIVLWGVKPLNQQINNQLTNKGLANQKEVQILRIEDGFIRSVGLGADLRRPSSLVVDSKGMYFDPRQPSDLEHILTHHEFINDELLQAKQLIDQLIKAKVSKYNVAEKSSELEIIKNITGNKILVVGQVEDDASIQTGCVDINTNLGLLKQVRLENPNSYIIYKPHPDVLSGNRIGNIDCLEVKKYADQQVIKAGIIETIDLVDELHTLTSLSGFEALLRGKQVSCYGLPFYASWGLTKDRHNLDRRKRKLTLAQLCYGSLIEYPLYINYHTSIYSSVNAIVYEMTGKQERFIEKTKLASLLGRNLRKIKFLYSALIK